MKKILLALCLLVAVILTVSSCEPAVFFPEEGEWYCEKLQIQVCFDPSGECWMISDGETIQCACGSDRGSSWLSVCSQDFDTEQYELGEEVFGGEFVRLEGNEMVIVDPLTDIEYTFIRVMDEKTEETK